MKEDFYVYILASQRRGTLYVGVTSNLPKRVYEHKNGMVEGFTKKYGVYRLVYYEIALKASIEESDFVITKTGFQGIPFANRNNAAVKRLLGNRAPLKTFTMRDGSDILLYSVSDSARGEFVKPLTLSRYQLKLLSGNRKVC
jgi:hypothetical protein